MYISLGLLWLSFKIIQGEIIQCPIGGLTDTEQCKKLTEESVFQRFFINKGNTSTHKLFENSLVLDEKIPIKDQWKQALKIGTDTYRIKFHTKLVNQYKHNDKLLSNEEWIVLIQSFYVAASTYYFSKNCDLANDVIDQGLTFFEIVTKDNQGKHARVWSIVLQTLKVDILICLDPHHNETLEIINKISEEEKQFDCPNYGSFPSSAVLLFRGYFLGKDIDDNMKTKLENWLEKKTLWEHFNDDILEWDYMSLYKFLVFFYNSPQEMHKIINIYKAIEKPVLSTEDRLLNYKATELALGIYTLCFEENKSPICIAFSNLKNIDPQLEQKITPKLRILYDLKNKDLKEKLKEELSLNYHIIEQDVLHLIVTAALDIDSEIYQKNIENVKHAIESLNDFVKHLKKKDTKNYTEQQRTKNLFIVYKWLIEMNGILSLSQDKNYQKQFEEALQKATNLSSNSSYNFRSDDHFKYLKAKLENKDRLKNLEAHELFTVFLMDLNESAIDLMEKYNNDITAIYKDLLMDPELCCKKKSKIISEEEKSDNEFWYKLHKHNNNV
ncbi:uncharacterized protein LOC114120731 isoform X3 [Aphis gossypii]|uniref:uncharacterized protein LOC114120731 isoform X3 n=1 Tax=Aphis gossypii TaxID=80765 RepID=UPI002159646C|nr:uncharacterized protein LOC114120731 isoform X3 [Aphis gossypii]